MPSYVGLIVLFVAVAASVTLQLVARSKMRSQASSAKILTFSLTAIATFIILNYLFILIVFKG